MSESPAEIKRHGKHYTPTDLARFLAERVVEHLDRARGELRILDPACGDGELLFAAHRVLSERRPGVAVRLTGYDLDQDALEVARARAAGLGVTVELHAGDFLDARTELDTARFDAVITNPPYVRVQQLGQATAQLLAARFGLRGRIDLTHPFVALLPALLRPDGVVGLLCSNRFLTTRAGANVRAVLQQSLQPVELYDLGDTKLFAAAVLPAIVIARNRAPDAAFRCVYASAYQDTEATPTRAIGLYEALTKGDDTVIDHGGRTIAIRSGHLAPPEETRRPWRLSHAAADAWLQRVHAGTWASFGEVARIRVGIKTTADPVFISDRWHERDPRPEQALLRPLLTQHDLLPWRVSPTPTSRVLYPYVLDHTKRTVVDLARYPDTRAYLEAHAERLRSRRYVAEGGREWFEIWVPQQPARWAQPKIVFPDISATARFALDRSGAIVNGNCYWMSLPDIGGDELAYLILAVANSRLGLRFYDEVCGNRLYSGRRRWMTQYVAQLPLPAPECDPAREIVALVAEVLGTGAVPSPHQCAAIDTLLDAAFGL
ncbi:Eco57I restriction-modification methylase domain-containing protein [Nocardia cyriacigeorgica]|uniref:Eco57I restriction-modification methylase domain-containing protein n=1 Tax=Nocardia cyriacigeorgica TaxID=135487 RepID=UPI002458158B|nr:N-6 DNA methylase [Nocardia cyriacigeorgica]